MANLYETFTQANSFTHLLGRVRWRFSLLKHHFPLLSQAGKCLWDMLAPRFRGQALVKNCKRPPDFRFSNIHSPKQDPIVLDFLNAAVPPQFFSKTIYECVSYLFTVL